MIKHIRDAIRQSGVPPAEIGRVPCSGHVVLVVKGVRIHCSSSPKNPVIATKKIANELSRAWK
jgi:hypothetical protein